MLESPLNIGICQEHKSLRSSFQLKWLFLTHFIYLSALSWPAKTDDCSTHHIKDLLHLGINHAWEGRGVGFCTAIGGGPADCLLDDALWILRLPFVWYCYYSKISQMTLSKFYPSYIVGFCIICSWDSLTLGCMANEKKILSMPKLDQICSDLRQVHHLYLFCNCTFKARV